MMKRLLLLVTLSMFSGVLMAQWAVNVNYNLWMPTGKYNSELKMGFLGANVEAKYIFDDHLAGSIGVGYALLNYETVRIDRVERPAEGYSDNAALQIIPITIGADVYFSTAKVRPYLDLDFGVAMVKTTGDNLPETDMTANTFLSPGFGIEYELSDGLKLNGVLKQQVLIYKYDDRAKYLETFTAVGINLGVTYKF
ncbi:MAG: outer membrane beta-barrel protein [Bacteroidota bacterium]